MLIKLINNTTKSEKEQKDSVEKERLRAELGAAFADKN